MEQFLKKNEFAKLCGVSAVSITKATKPGKALEHALSGDKIDLATVQAQEYAKAKGIKLPKFKTVSASAQGAALPTSIDPSQYMNLTLNQIMKRYGNMQGFKDVVATQKMVSEVQIKELQAAEMRGKMIPREIVKHHIFGHLETANVRLLGDFPRTVTQRVWSMAQAGLSPQEAEKEIREMVSKIVDDATRQTVKVLKEAS